MAFLPYKNLLKHYFPTLEEVQITQLAALEGLYLDWNSKLNLVSRKDIQNLYLHHVLHSLSIAKVVSFMPGAHILDFGTGGGFPGIPLAILFPKTHFVLVDSIGKKVRAVADIADKLGLHNAAVCQARGEKMDGWYDFVVSRSVGPLDQLSVWIGSKIKPTNTHSLPNGLLYLQGGEVDVASLATIGLKCDLYPIRGFFAEPFFETKQVVHCFLPKEPS